MSRSRLALVAGLLGGVMAVPAVRAPAVPAPAASVARVVISELHYHPFDDDPAEEFVEFTNLESVPVDAGGWCVAAVGYCFPMGFVVQAGARLVLTRAQYPGTLDDDGEEVRLVDADGRTVDVVQYGDHGVWPAEADGYGPSLERRDLTAAGDDPGNWATGTGPTPGTVNSVAGVGLLPVFSAVTHTVRPAAGAPVEVVAAVAHASSATLYYRVGFGAEVAVPMTHASGVVTATIPGQAAGSLVRYRLSATAGGRTGTWPRQGDGARYTGTTVRPAADAPLPRFEWFMPDLAYRLAARASDPSLARWRAAVIAVDGEVFDDTLVRVADRSSRFAGKRDWEFVLPAGHLLAVPGVLAAPVDGFSLHGAAADKSMIREVLTSEWYAAAGVVGVPQAFPVQLDRNGAFFGLYTYAERPGATWRRRHGWTDAAVYGAGLTKPDVALAGADGALSRRSFAQRYVKEGRRYEPTTDLRELIWAVNTLRGEDRRAWLAEHVDLPQVVNVLAAAQVVHDFNFAHRGYRLVRSEGGKWQLVPGELDLTWGRTYDSRRNTKYADAVGVSLVYPWAAGNRLAQAVSNDPVLRPLLDRRTRTLVDELLTPARVEARAAELQAAIAPLTAADRARWGSYGERQTPEVATAELLTAYVPFRRVDLLTRPGVALPGAASAFAAVTIAGVDVGAGRVSVRNDEPVAVDLSGWRLEPVGVLVPAGLVVPAGGEVGVDASLAGADEVRLVSPDGDVLARYSVGAGPLAGTGGPPDVTNLVAYDVAPREAALTWTALDAPAVVGYRVYVNGRLAGTPVAATYHLSGLPDATTVLVEVVAVDGAGRTSAAPATVELVLGDGTPPSPVHLKKVSTTRTEITATWTAPVDLSGIRYYEISLDGGPPKVMWVPFVRYSGLARRSTHHLEIRAIDLTDRSSVAVVVVATTR